MIQFLVNISSVSNDSNKNVVKLFNSIEEMQADTTTKEGDLALVYKSDTQNVTVDSKFSSAIFPTTVVLPKAMTDYAEVMYRAVDNSVMFECWGNLDSSVFRMDCYTETGSIRISYISSDGITYTRTDGGEEIIDFGTEIYYYYPEMWNDAIGHFIIRSGKSFYGLYQYKTNEYVLAPTQLTAIPEYVFDAKFYGANGIEQGTLATNVSNTFVDINAELFSAIQAQYDSMTPRVLTDTDKTVDETIKVIPSKCDGTPLLDTSAVTNATYMFSNRKNLVTISGLNTSNIADATYMFSGCSALAVVPILDMSSANTVFGMFSGCTKLTTVPILNISSVVDVGDMFAGCNNLSDDSLNNILAMCVNATKMQYNKTLKRIGLSNTQATKCTTLSNYSAFTAAGWTTGY